MKPRLPDVPVLRTKEGAVGAATFNRILRTFARLGTPQELVLGGRGLYFRLERELWLCTDLRLNEVPLIAWSGFDTGRRAGLHAPVACQVFYYHAYARVIEHTVLNDVDRRLETRLAEQGRAAPVVRGPRVVNLRRETRIS